MKKNIIILLILVLNNYLAFTQHPDLQNTNWYVQSVTVNGNTTEISLDPIEFPFAYIKFFSGSTNFISSKNINPNFFSTTDICKIGFTGHLIYTSDNIFTFNDINIIQDSVSCSTELQNFMNLYVSIYNDVSINNFTYTINSESNGTKTLTVINANNDYIVYTNHFYNPAPVELKSNYWVLDDLVIDNNNNVPPNNAELTIVILDFEIDSNFPELFTIFACAGFQANSNFDYSSNTFYLYESSVSTTDCGITENEDFQNLYFDFYIDNLPGPFSYLLTEDNSTLTISVPNGDYAVYSNQVGATSDFSYNNIKIFPNPTKNTLNFHAAERLNNIIITDIQGRIIIEKSINDYNTIIDLSNIEKGIYFANIYDINNKLRKIEKVIKK